MAAYRESLMLYEAADGTEIPLVVFDPSEAVQPSAGIVLFHGGGLRKGSAAGLAPHCRYLASRGIFAVTAGYRLLGQGAVGIDDCVADVRRAIKQFGRLAALRGLDASRLAWGGSSAGAHLALVAAMIVQDKATAVVALNPAGLDLLSYDPDLQRRLEDEVGIPAGRLIDYSLIEFVRQGNPPMLILHGTDDDVAPIGQARRFRDAMLRSGNECTLIEYEEAGHAFHYPGDSGHFEEVMEATAGFLLDRFAAN